MTFLDTLCFREHNEKWTLFTHLMLGAQMQSKLMESVLPDVQLTRGICRPRYHHHSFYGFLYLLQCKCIKLHHKMFSSVSTCLRVHV